MREEGKRSHVVSNFPLQICTQSVTPCTVSRPMFFPHLREEEKEAYKVRLDALWDRYKSWEKSESYLACTTVASNILDATTEDTTPEASDASDAAEIEHKFALELCAGEEVVTKALRKRGFKTASLDNDLKRSATSQLSLDQLEERITSGHIHDHPHLNKAFAVIWAAPECRTWSKASCGKYRNTIFIDGYHGRALERDALQARRDIESLVNILSYYQSINPSLIIVIENPVGYLRHHPVSQLFSSILHLTRVTVSYCQFNTKGSSFPRKDTHFWTNSSIMISEFGNNQYKCQVGSSCYGKHEKKVQDMPDKCSAYPAPMISFISGLLGKSYLSSIALMLCICTN